jgi:hypothetical protein
VDRLSIAKAIYAVGLLAMPLTYGLRDLLGLNFTWIDPTLIIALLVSLLLAVPIPDRRAVWLVASSLLAALCGAMLISPATDRGKSALYIICMEPTRLALNILWYCVSIYFLRISRRFVLRWLVITISVQFAIATYLYLALCDLVPAPDLLQVFLYIYKIRQTVWISDVPVYRMAGTFFESPPFSLFMFCCFVVCVLAWLQSEDRGDRRWLLWGAGLSFTGAVMGLADQVLLAIPLFGFGLLPRMARRGRMYKLLPTALLLIVIAGAGAFLIQKLGSTKVIGQDIYANSIAERSFHVRYGLSLFEEEPISSIFGIGPGRYGDYAGRTGIFPSTVTIQVTAVEWIVEYGILGCIVIGVWLNSIARRSITAFGWLGISALGGLVFADMFQGNWKWESWFFAMAFLYTSGDHSLRSIGRSE